MGEGGGERGESICSPFSFVLLLPLPRRGFLDSPRFELASLPPRGRDRDTETQEKKEREREELRGGREYDRVQPTETSSRRNDRKTEVARGTFRRLRTHSQRPATEVHAGSSRVNRTHRSMMFTLEAIKNYLPLAILSQSTDIPRLKIL